MRDLFSDNPIVKPDPKEFTIIDFGIGKIAVKAEPGSSIVVTELIEALQKVAMIVPLQQVVHKVNSMNRF